MKYSKNVELRNLECYSLFGKVFAHLYFYEEADNQTLIRSRDIPAYGSSLVEVFINQGFHGQGKNSG